MIVALVDYDSGNLHSAEKAVQLVGRDADAQVVVTADPEVVARADRIILPGDGAFPACKAALDAVPGLTEALNEAVLGRAVPFLGICVGMQMLATTGHEYHETPGLGWVAGAVRAISAPGLKVPHMGWNDLVIERPHPVLDGIVTGDHVYFVHSWQFMVDEPAQRLAHADYGGPISAVIGRDNIVGTQFHPEKSQTVGLRLLGNFLRWRP